MAAVATNKEAVAPLCELASGSAMGVVPPTAAAGCGPGTLATASAHGSDTTCLATFAKCKDRSAKATTLQLALKDLDAPTAEMKKAEKDAVDACRQQLQECIDCGSYDDLLKDAATLAGPVDLDVTADDLDRWARQAYGRDGIILARDEPEKGVKAKR